MHEIEIMNLKTTVTSQSFSLLFVGSLFAFTLLTGTLTLRADDNDDLWATMADGDVGEDYQFDLGTPHVTELWLSARPPRSRDIHYLYPCYPTILNENKLDISFFANRNSRIAHVFQDYFDPEALRSLIRPDFAPDIVKADALTDALAQFTIREWKVGTVVQYDQILTKNLQLEFTLPFSASLRHFWIPTQTQKTLKSLFDEGDPAETPDPATEELKKVLTTIPAKIAPGDLAMKFSYLLPEYNGIKSALGAELIVPISSFFNSTKPLVLPQLKDVLTGNLTSKQDMADLFKEVQLVAMRPSFGSEGHAGIGGFFNIKCPLFREGFDFWSIVRFTYYLPKNQYRFIPIGGSGKSPAEFEVRVVPGTISQIVMGLDWKPGNWLVQGGYDFYMQNKEFIGRSVRLPQQPSDVLRPEDAERTRAIQHKIFGSIGYLIDNPSATMRITLGVDGTIGHSGIGKGYAGTLGFGLLF